MFCFRGIRPNSRACCEFQCCQWSILWPASVKKGRITSRAARQFCGKILTDFEQKGPRRGLILTKNSFSPLIPSNSREVSNKYCYFPTHTGKDSVFLKPKFLNKGKLLGDRIFFFSGQIFLLNWPKSFAKSWRHW
jgi:hypothetical protein